MPADHPPGTLEDPSDSRGPAGGELWLTVLFVLFLCAGILALQVDWEGRAALIVADHHFSLFMETAAETWRWLLGLPPPEPDPMGSCSPDARGIFPPTKHYPPLAFLLAAWSMVWFGLDLSVARGSQAIFVCGFVACMARVGWQLAGSRGAMLLALGAASAPWTLYFLLNFTLLPGQFMALALTMTLLLDSESLTRPRSCVAVGLALGLGMLVKQSFLLYSLPLMAAAALHGAPRVSGAWRGALAVAGTLGALACFILSVPEWKPQEGLEQTVKSQIPVLVLGAELLFAGLFVLAQWSRRRRGQSMLCDSGVGLALAVSVAGMVCSPWYMAHLELLLVFAGGQWQFSPVAEAIQPAPEIWYQALYTLNAFHAGGMLWFLGTLALPGWGAVRSRVFPFLAGFLGSLAIYTVLLPSVPRYLAPILPLALVVGFLWAARWRSVFLVVMVAQLALGALQLPWLVPVPGTGVFRAPSLPEYNPASRDAILVWSLPEPTEEGATLDPLKRIEDGATVAVRRAEVEMDGDGGVFNLLTLYLGQRAWPQEWRKGRPLRAHGLPRVDYVLAPPENLDSSEQQSLQAIPGARVRLHYGPRWFQMQLFKVLPARLD